jgi:O-acetyl-ADP-ribose deacetylase (regulator of RNase III)/RNA recognition motif-containing protein
MQQNQLNSKNPKTIHNASFDQYETCWIGNVTDKVPNSELEVYFKINAETIGKIHGVKIKRNENKNNYCFINFFKREHAQQAADFFNGKKLYDLTLQAKYNQKNNDNKNNENQTNKAKKKVEVSNERNVKNNKNLELEFKKQTKNTNPSGFHACWIGNISAENSENDLKQFFSSQLGSFKDNLIDIQFKKIEHSIQCFIYFNNKKNAEEAVKIFNQSKLDGRVLISLYKFYSSIQNSSRNNSKPLKLLNFKDQAAKNVEKENENEDDGTEEDEEEDEDEDDESEIENEDDENYFFFKQEEISDSDDSSDDDDSFSVSSLISTHSNSNQEFSRTIHKKNFGYFKRFISRRINKLKLEHKNVEFIVFERNKIDLIIKIKSNDLLAAENAEKVVRSWNVVRKQLSFKKYEFDQIKALKKELITIRNNYNKQNAEYKSENFLKFDQKRKQIVLFVLNANNERSCKLFDQIKSFCFNKIKFRREFLISNSEEFDLLNSAYKSKDYKRKKKLENVNFEFDANSKKVTISAPKLVSDSLNFSNLVRVYSCNRDYVVREKYALSFIKYQFRRFKKEFSENMCILKLSEEEIITKSSFQMIGLDKAEVERNADKLKSFIENARVDSIQIEENLFSKAEEIVTEFREKKKRNEASNDTEESNSNDQEKYNIDLNFNEKLKKIFINGTDQDEITQTKSYLLQKLQGFVLTVKSIHTNKLLLNKLLENRELFGQLRAKYQNLQIYISFNDESLIRLIGEQIQINEAIKEINVELKKISNDIIVDTIELEKSEFNYLLTKQEEMLKILNESNTLIQMDSFEKCGEISLKNMMIEFLCGDITKLSADAYVNPINQNMSLSNLNKAIFDKAGYFVRKQVETFKKTKSVEFVEGKIFQTISGDLGLKRSSKIFHLIKPVLKTDPKSYDSILSNCVVSTLKEADKENLQTIAIPPISDDRSFDIILGSVLNYLKTSAKSNLKRIIFISDEPNLIQEWTRVSIKNEPKIKPCSKNLIFLFGYGSDCERTKKSFENTFSRMVLPHSSIYMAVLKYIMKDVEINITISNKTIILFGTRNNVERISNELFKYNSSLIKNPLEDSISSEKIKKEPKLKRKELEKNSVEYKTIYTKLMASFKESLPVEHVKIEKLKSKK